MGKNDTQHARYEYLHQTGVPGYLQSACAEAEVFRHEQRTYRRDPRRRHPDVGRSGTIISEWKGIYMSRHSPDTLPPQQAIRSASILVTGGAGFIGSNFIRFLLEQTDFKGKIVNYDKLTYAGNLLNLADVEKQFGGKRYFFER